MRRSSKNLTTTLLCNHYRSSCTLNYFTQYVLDLLHFRRSQRMCFVKKEKLLLKFRKFRRKTPVLESPFNKVAGLTCILKDICERLLLTFSNIESCQVIVFLLFTKPINVRSPLHQNYINFISLQVRKNISTRNFCDFFRH